MNIINLYSHQQNAIKKTIENNYESGIHFHATGTGKSYIALNILFEYHKKYPKRNIIWFCEQKSILHDFFNNINISTLISKNLDNSIKIFNLVDKHDSNFINNLNNSLYFLIINRAYLTYSKRYTKLENLPGLIIHDECHSIGNNSTKELINFFNEYGSSIIGFSATPEFTGIYKNIISEYSIYSAFCDNNILSPKIIWFENTKNIIKNISYLINQLYYKKIIVWGGLIENSSSLMQEWKQYFTNFLFAIDTSKQSINIEEFYKAENNAILFCAAKHREGSDIKNLDCCIFMDLVTERTSKTFIQCIGRVLRKDKDSNKKSGLIIDYKARSAGEVLSRLNKYIHTDNFPWDYKKYNINDSNFYELRLIKTELNTSVIELNTSKDTIIKSFKRNINNYNDNINYSNRLKYELDLLEIKDLFSYLLQAIKILELTNDIPHVTRGSCGSSLVCYLLGISNVDPVKYNIKFSRFLNEYRNNLPDIDFDFPHYKRDEVFIRISKKWPNQIARISNHIHFHKKSAEREALRKLGYNNFIDKYSVQKMINKLTITEKIKFDKTVNDLEGSFRTYSLHCGGIVFYPDGVPSELKINNGLIDQVNLDKRDVSKDRNFKIDILSSKGISQLLTYYSTINKELSFTSSMTDKNVFDLFKKGENIGITLAESPLIRKTFLMFQPETVEDLAICLSVIRPIAKESRKEGKVQGIIYDDDAIDLIRDYFKVSEDYADKLRREFSKGNFNSLKEYNKSFDKLPDCLKELGMYSFCKAHAMSYAQLIYKLAEFKLNNPKEFWISTIKNCSSSYKKWVHAYEASKYNSYYNDTKEKSVYCKERCTIDDGPIEQLKKSGLWSFKDYPFIPNCYLVKKIIKDEIFYCFCGIIAHIRVLSITAKKKSLVSLICTGNEYIEINTNGNFYFSPKSYMLSGIAKLDCKITKSYTAKSFKYIVN